MSSGPSGTSNSHTSNSHDNYTAGSNSLGLMNVARVWTARGLGGLKDTDWYIELESLSETLTCKVLLIKDFEHVEQGKKRPREVGGTEEGGAESMVPIAEELVVELHIDVRNKVAMVKDCPRVEEVWRRLVLLDLLLWLW